MIDLIMRGDDYGSAISANKAIAACVREGQTIKNISVMSCGKYLEEGAEFLRSVRGVDIGMHAVLNSEWDPIKWTPCSPKAQIASLLNSDGEFYASQQELMAADPDIDECIREYDAQLDHLARLGIPVTYADSHMAPEIWIPDLIPAFRDWIRRKGLLDVTDCYYYAGAMGPDWGSSYEEFTRNTRDWLLGMPEDRENIHVIHAAMAGEDTMAFYNRGAAPGIICQQRDWEYRMFSSGIRQYPELMERIHFMRFSEAHPSGDGIVFLKKLFGIPQDETRICPCCRHYAFEEKNAYEICPVCGWEDDPIQRKDPDYAGGANKMSLREARRAFAG